MNFILRPWTMNDLDSLFENANNSKITRYMSDAFPDTIEKWKTFLEYATTDTSILYLAIVVDGKAVGGIGVSPKKDAMQKNAELGFWLGENYWGKGIITKAITRIVKLAFDRFDINRVYATPYETNHASHRVLEKAGFTLEAIHEKAVMKNGVLLDEFIYAIRKNK